MKTLWLLCRLLPWLVSLYVAAGLSASYPLAHASMKRTLLCGFCASSGDENQISSGTSLSDNIIESLDLAPLLRAISNHAGTRRGRQALLSLVGEAESQQKQKSSSNGQYSARRQIIDTLQFQGGATSRREMEKGESAGNDAMALVSVAGSVSEAREEYEMTEQALLALKNVTGSVYPPLYGADSSPWNSNKADTDYDEWLLLPIDSWTLEYVLQADQVVSTLLKVRDWADDDSTRTWLPGLSDMGRKIPRDELLSLHSEIRDTVKVIRGRSILDPMGKSSFAFRLNPDMFPTLSGLNEQESQLSEAIDRHLVIELRKLKGSNEVVEFQGRKVLSVPKTLTSSDIGILRGKSDSGGRYYVEPRRVVSIGDELARVQQQAHTMQEEIEQRLFHSIMRSANLIDISLQQMARLDVIFAKAAWGYTMNGKIPLVGEGGQIEVKDFVHPVLALSNGFERVVPVDLFLSGDQRSNALIISGANGGGKTVALKSFGLVSLICKLGIPVPSSSRLPSEAKPKVDFIDDVLVEVGDKQSVVEGESTLMARLNACAAVIQRVSNAESALQHRSSLVLLDELGGGTDPSAGSAIAQAVLEKLIENKNCRIVATTHSPQLKALSLQSKQFDCATVLLKGDPSSSNGLQQPSFRLEYGSIGDSHALAAAHRCTPALPDNVLSRAADLISSEEPDGRTKVGTNQIGAMIQQLEWETQAAYDSRISTEQILEDSKRCRDAMLSLSESYAQHLSALEQRLDTIFKELNEDETKGSIEVVGDTLAELRTLKKKVKSDEEMLRERGLKVATDSYQFSDGESVVILAKGEWEGEMAKVILSDNSPTDELARNEVLVIPSVSSWGGTSLPTLDAADQDLMVARPLIFQRFEVAIWDYDSVWDDDSPRPPAKSTRESRRKLFDVLSSIKSTSSDAKIDKKLSRNKSSNSAFTSSRERKAASRGKKNKKSKKRQK